jgi:hypothetical protein
VPHNIFINKITIKDFDDYKSRNKKDLPSAVSALSLTQKRVEMRSNSRPKNDRSAEPTTEKKVGAKCPSMRNLKGTKHAFQS